MVLLNSSTVSVVLSSGVVCMFTFLLFLSGYVLQQQSVRSIQHALRTPASTPAARSFIPKNGVQDDTYGLQGDGRGDFSGLKDGGGSGQSVLADLESDGGKAYWAGGEGKGGSYAYLQLLSTPDPSNICSAILFFKNLAASGTAVQDRLFMYPQDWDVMTNPSERVSTALSLLRSASSKYNIWLLPIDMSLATKSGYGPTDSRLLRLGQIQFLQYDSVLYLRTPGLLLDGKKLDRFLLSRPLPMKHDKNRRESYHNEAWSPMPLRPDRATPLPPAYLIAVNNMGDHVEARTHVPNMAIPEFRGLVTGPDGGGVDIDIDDAERRPAYVFFEQDDDGHVRWKGNPLFGTWRAQQHEVCEGLDLEGD
ncbi:hypothetical protein VTN00DRAFT_1171 [Thermoascus crustaceus]|uniref:uncharacterized protein n=1 Tax=Thermoascus crustaceus TaxID=5088 RepID=UPI003743DC93